MRLEPKKVEKASSRLSWHWTSPGHKDTKRASTRASSMGLDDDCSPGYPPDDLMIQGLGCTMWPASSLLKTIPLGGFWECLHFRNLPTCCRWDISLVSNAPIGTGFGPQNITVITNQESHHWHAFLIRFAETHFPYSLETET